MTWELVKAVGTCLGVGSIPYFPAFQCRGGAWERWWVGLLIVTLLYATLPSSVPLLSLPVIPKTIWRTSQIHNWHPNANVLGLRLKLPLNSFQNKALQRQCFQAGLFKGALRHSSALENFNAFRNISKRSLECQGGIWIGSMNSVWRCVNIQHFVITPIKGSV